MPTPPTDRRLSKLAESAEGEQPFPRYDSSSQRFWRDLRIAKKFPGGR